MTIWQFMDFHPFLTVFIIIVLLGFIENVVKIVANRNKPHCNCDEED